MRIETAMRLLAEHAEGPVEWVGPDQVRAVVYGRRVDVLSRSGWVGAVSVQAVSPAAGGGETQQTSVSFNSLRDGLCAALHGYRAEAVPCGGAVIHLAAEVTHEGVGLRPDLHLQINEVVVSTLQDGETLAMAEQFFQTGEGRPLLDWLQERSPEVAAEVGRVRRLAAR
jgi:hypothetical protein